MWRRLEYLRTLVTVGNLQPPRLVTGVVVAAAASLLICWPVWPGLMSYDSLFAYRQSIEGVEIADWPPMHDYLFYLSRKLTGGPGGLFGAQTFVLFFSASVIIGVHSSSRMRYVIGIVFFGACCFYFPTLHGTLIVNWKDVLLASFSLLAIALWLVALRFSSRMMLLPVAAALVGALSVRLNSLPMLLPFLVAFLLQPVGAARPGSRVFASIVVVAAIVLAHLSTVWRLPDMKPLPPLGHTFAGVQLWDLVGISVCADKNLLPLPRAGSAVLSVDELRAAYDPRHVDLTLLPRNGVTPLERPTAGTFADLSRAWRAAVLAYPHCYLHHRTTVFEYQMGIAPKVFIPTHGGIDANDFGISLRHPEAAQAQIQSIESGADTWLRRPFWLYILAVGATLLAIVNRWRSVPLVVILGSGAILYVASFFFLAPAADARYIFPANIFCALLLAIALPLIGERRKVNASRRST
jgi:hypothetical protein